MTATRLKKMRVFQEEEEDGSALEGFNSAAVKILKSEEEANDGLTASIPIDGFKGPKYLGF